MKQEKRTERLHVPLTATEKERVIAAADKAEMTISEWVRNAIRQTAKEEENKHEIL